MLKFKVVKIRLQPVFVIFKLLVYRSSSRTWKKFDALTWHHFPRSQPAFGFLPPNVSRTYELIDPIKNLYYFFVFFSSFLQKKIWKCPRRWLGGLHPTVCRAVRKPSIVLSFKILSSMKMKQQYQVHLRFQEWLGLWQAGNNFLQLISQFFHPKFQSIQTVFP